MVESKFQALLIKELYKMFAGCVVLKNDANYIQGFPDLLVLYEGKWAALECKKSRHDGYQPNQEYYLDFLNRMSFARVVYPENKEEVLDDLQQAFRSNRFARVPRR